MNQPQRPDRLLALCALVVIAACSGKGDDGSARAATPGGGATGTGAPAGAGGGRRGATITLAQADVQRAQRTSVERGVEITGDLRPIETIDVRSRLEGDIVGVFARDGERVTRGQLLARFEASEQTSDRRSAEAEQVAARGALTTAEWNHTQAKELFTAGAIPERDLRVAEQEVATARARLAAATARVRASSSNEEDTRVVAPTTGIVEKRHIESGERVARGAVLFTVVRNETLELAAAVPARQSSDIRVGQAVHFTADGRQLDGRVARVSPTIDPASRAVTVYVQIPNASGSLRGGTFANGRIVVQTVPDAIVVPTTALRQTAAGGDQLVYRIANQTLEPVSVKTGVTDDARALTQITQGIREGDVVVVGNVGTLGRGMKVTIIGEENAGGGRRAAPAAGASSSRR